MSTGLFEKPMTMIQPGMTVFCSDEEEKRGIFDHSFSRKMQKKGQIFLCLET